LIPKKIYQTNKLPQPDFAVENIKNLNSEYGYQFFNDDDCVQFIQNFFGSDVLDVYFNMRTLQHRADLFRYCLLYTYGGVYVDIDIQMLSPIDDIIDLSENSKLISVKDVSKGHGIYQGFLVSEPKNEIFLPLIEDMLKNPNPQDYAYHIEFFGKQLLKKSKLNEFILNEKVQMDDGDNYFLFKEIKNGKSEYVIVDKNNQLIFCGNNHRYPYEGYTKCCSSNFFSKKFSKNYFK
jgi:hypothetical protein